MLKAVGVIMLYPEMDLLDLCRSKQYWSKMSIEYLRTEEIL